MEIELVNWYAFVERPLNAAKAIDECYVVTGNKDEKHFSLRKINDLNQVICVVKTQ